jgi:hypothetical protein
MVTSGGQSILCARKPSAPTLRPQCDQGWSEVSRSKAKTLSKQGWEIKAVTSGGQSILCAKARSLPPPLSPADECRKRGWIWDGARCLSPADACQQKGWVWQGNRCLSPEEACRNRGWVWDRRRQRCVPKEAETPVPPPEPQLKVIPGPFKIICPEGTVWSETYNKCMPRID